MGGLPKRAHLHASESLVLLGGVDDQLGLVLNGTAHIIGQPAASVGDVRALGDDKHLICAVLPLTFGSGLGASGHAADD